MFQVNDDFDYRSWIKSRRAKVLISCLLITIEGLLFLGLFFKGYHWYAYTRTDAINKVVQEKAAERIENQWQKDHQSGKKYNRVVQKDGIPYVEGPKHAAKVGDEIAQIFIPRLGDSDQWKFTIMEGVTQSVIAAAPGRYPGSSAPGQIGNFAMAGHRVGRGSPFEMAETMKTCDPIRVETSGYTLTYTMLPTSKSDIGEFRNCVSPTTYQKYSEDYGLPGREIVKPDDYEVVWANPGKSDDIASSTLPLLTITTCHPKYSDAERMVLHAVLTDIKPKGSSSK